MSDQDGGDRPRWEGFPGGVDPAQPPIDPSDPLGDLPPVEPAFPAAGAPPVPPAPEAPPVAPQFPIQPVGEDVTAPIPVVGTAPVDVSGSGLGPRRSRSSQSAPRRDTSRL